VIAPSTDDKPRQEFHQKSKLERACLLEAGRRFTQAQYMPLLTPPLIEFFGECGKPKAIEQVLQGTFSVPSQCDNYAAKLLLALVRPPTISEVAPRSLTSYSNGWKKARESTSSSASGLHFGHYIAGTFNPEIFLVNATMADIPLRTGFSYD